MNAHQRIDERSLAFGRAIAAKVKEHPEFIDKARSTIDRWLLTVSPSTRGELEQWKTALDGPIEGVLVLLTGRDDRSRRLRQSNPFVGVLTEIERMAIIREFASPVGLAALDDWGKCGRESFGSSETAAKTEIAPLRVAAKRQC